VVWPLLASGTQVGAAVLTAAFAQVGGVGSGLLSEAVIRSWDRLRKREGASGGQREFREALAAELQEALTSTSPMAAGLRAEVAGVLQGVDAVKVALTATIETTVQESADQVRDALVRGLRELGTQFAEFGWLLEEVSDQLRQIVIGQTELAAGTRALLEGQQQASVHLMLLRQEIRSARIQEGGPANLLRTAAMSADGERAAALEASGVPVSPECPYPGLAAYQPKDADRFFGRRQLTGALVARLAEQLARPGLLMVLGPSGSGKSSLLRAGLLPAIAAGALPVKDSETWPLDLMTPGRHPLLELAARIAALAGLPAGAVEADLRSDPGRITAAIRQVLLTHARRQAQCSGPGPALAGTSPSARLVLIVDQFEELFTLCADERERRTFVRALCAAAGVTAAVPPGGAVGPSSVARGSPEAAALVTIGIRADFYASSATYPEFLPYLQNSQVLVGPMDEEGLRAAIEEPAAGAGLVVDAGLVGVLLSELGLRGSPPDGGYEAGRLPLLAYALQQTWQQREGRRLTIAAYRATGGIDGAVARAAEAVYAGLDADTRLAARRLLLRMVSLGEGTADTRRPATVAELTGATTLSEATGPASAQQGATNRAVLTRLIQARLVTASTNASGMETAQISHEALLSAWPRLRQWLTQDRAGQRIHRDLAEAATAWQAQGRPDPSRLFRGTRLTVAREWANSHDEELNTDERAFLIASRQREHRGTWLRRTVAVSLAVLLAVAVAGWVKETKAARNSDHQRVLALSAALAGQSEQLETTDPATAALLAAAAWKTWPTAQAREAMLDVLAQPERAVLPGGLVGGQIVFSPGGTLVADVGTSGRTQLWKPATGQLISSVLKLPTGTVPVALSSGGKILVTSTTVGQGLQQQLQRWDVATGSRAGAPLRAPPGGGGFWTTYGLNGHLLTCACSGNSVRLWDMTTGHPVSAAARLIVALHGTEDEAISPDLQKIVQIANNGVAYEQDIATGRRTGARLTVHTFAYRTALSPGGRVLAIADHSGLVTLWNMATGQREGAPLPVPGGVSDMTFSPDGTTLATTGDDGSTRLWDVNLYRQTGRPLTLPNGVYAEAFSPDGKTMATIDDGGIGLWNLASHQLSGKPIVTGSGGLGTQLIAFSPEGKILAATYGRGNTAGLWDVATRRQIGKPLAAGYVSVMAFDPSGRILATAPLSTGPIRLWDVATHQQIGAPLAVHGLVHAMAFSADGKTLLAAGGPPLSDGTWIRGWQVSSHTQVRGPFKVPPFASAVFGHGGRIMATAGIDGTIRVWDPATGTQIGTAFTTGTNFVNAMAFSPNGALLATAGTDSTVHLWDTSTDREIGGPMTPYIESVHTVAFSASGNTLATGGGSIQISTGPGGNGTVWLWDLAFPRNLLHAVCTLAGHPFTRQQWHAYLPSEPYQKTCP
jgi:WD40 repeat protein